MTLYFYTTNYLTSIEANLYHYISYMLITINCPKSLLYTALYLLFMLNVDSNFESHVSLFFTHPYSPITHKPTRIITFTL
jgi:hypothetical protein